MTYEMGETLYIVRWELNGPTVRTVLFAEQLSPTVCLIVDGDCEMSIPTRVLQDKYANTPEEAIAKSHTELYEQGYQIVKDQKALYELLKTLKEKAK